MLDFKPFAARYKHDDPTGGAEIKNKKMKDSYSCLKTKFVQGFKCQDYHFQDALSQIQNDFYCL